MFLDDSFPRPLSAQIHGKQRTAPTLAHAWRAAGVQDIGNAVDQVLAADTAADAKRLAQSKLPVLGWSQVREETRNALLRIKFADPFMQNLLLRTSPALLRTKGLDWLRVEVEAATPSAATPTTPDPIDTAYREAEEWSGEGGPSASRRPTGVVPAALPEVGRVVSSGSPKVDSAGSGGTWITYPGAVPILLAPGVIVKDESTLLGIGGTQTVSEARATLLAGFSLKKQFEQDCPCCGKRGVADSRAITRHDGKCLITLCRAFAAQIGTTLPALAKDLDTLWPKDGGPWLCTNKAGGRAMAQYGINVHGGGRVWSQLRYRGLLAEGTKDESDTAYRGSARWRPTPLGVLFATGMVSIPNKVTTFDNALAVGPWMNGAAEAWNMVNIKNLKNFDFAAFMRGEG